MSIDFFVPEVSDQTSSVETLCKNHIAVMENVKQGIEAFISESGLSGEAYESAKEYFQAVYIPLADGFILLSEEMMRAHKRFVNNYLSQVDSNSLQSTVLEQQIREIKMMIRALEAMRLSSAGTSAASAAMIAALRALLEKLKDKLERLIQYHSSSPQIFTETESILADVEKGLQEIKSGRAWNATANRFDTNMLDMSWVAGIKERKKESVLQMIKQIISNMSSEELNEVENMVKNDKDAFMNYIKEKYINTLYSLGGAITAESLQFGGKSLEEFGDHIIKLFGKDGKVNFNRLNRYAHKTGDFFIRQGKAWIKVGVGVGTSFMAAGFSYGMYKDIEENDKSVGEAIAHNGLILGAGVLPIAVAGFFVSNPVGWITVSLGAGLSFFLDYMYEENKYGLQDTVDSIGEAIEKEIEDLIIVGPNTPFLRWHNEL